MSAPNRKRPAVPIGTGGAKKIRVGVGAAIVKREATDDYVGGVVELYDESDLRNEFLAVFQEPEHKAGIANQTLKDRFGESKYLQLAPIINQLMTESRLNMSRMSDGSAKGGVELFYTLVTENIAAKFSGLDVSARLVYQIIEKAGDRGIWTKEIRMQSNIQQQALNKIFKSLESRRLIKPVKSVNAKAKKLYMLFDLTPSKELTGGVWYSDLEFDYGFIQELRNFFVQCARRLNGGRGVTLNEIRDKMMQANVSKVNLSLADLEQIMDTLLYDYILEETGTVNEQTGQVLYVQAKRISTMCEFKWWDVLAHDFNFRTIHFEDGVTLAPHEHHYHTA